MQGQTAPGTPRPAGASPLRASLVPAFAACAAANRTHGPPLAHPACSPPAPASQQLTVGTPDANGQAVSSVGSARLGVRPGDPATGPDEADVAVVVSVTDVRRRSGLGDYTGELALRLPLRITDRDNGGTSSTDHGTVQDAALDVPVPCAATEHVGRLDLCRLDDRRRGRPGRGPRGRARDLGARPGAGARRRRGRHRLHVAQHAVRCAGDFRPLSRSRVRRLSDGYPIDSHARMNDL